MAYVIAESCIGVKDAACVEVSPVDCIYSTEGDDMYYIHPEECIDSAMCEPECPAEAIFFEEDLPKEWDGYADINADYDCEKGQAVPGL